MPLNCRASTGIADKKHLVHSDNNKVELKYEAITLHNHKCSGNVKAYYYLDQNGEISSTSLCDKAVKQFPEQTKYQASYYEQVSAMFSNLLGSFIKLSNNKEAEQTIYGNQAKDKDWNLELHEYNPNTECLGKFAFQHNFPHLAQHNCMPQTVRRWAEYDFGAAGVYTLCDTHSRQQEIAQRVTGDMNLIRLT
ncbi:MAG: hypothetical protein RLZZ210_19 [Pseudomonadota bacterium]|jgi:hypothetical protein